MSAHTVFLAEDNRGDILLVKQALIAHQIQHDLHIARDGGEALEFVAQIGKPGGVPCPDIILLDLNLPKVDGPAVLAEFQHSPVRSHPGDRDQFFRYPEVARSNGRARRGLLFP